MNASCPKAKQSLNSPFSWYMYVLTQLAFPSYLDAQTILLLKNASHEAYKLMMEFISLHFYFNFEFVHGFPNRYYTNFRKITVPYSLIHPTRFPPCITHLKINGNVQNMLQKEPILPPTLAHIKCEAFYENPRLVPPCLTHAICGALSHHYQCITHFRKHNPQQYSLGGSALPPAATHLYMKGILIRVSNSAAPSA